MQQPAFIITLVAVALYGNYAVVTSGEFTWRLLTVASAAFAARILTYGAGQ